MKKDKTIWPLVGHEKIVEYLTDSIKRGNIFHSYLFSGPSRIGKFTLAYFFTKTLQCESGGLVFCDDCQACRQIENSIHPDTIIFQNKMERVKIEEIRELQKKLNLKHFHNSKSSKLPRYKIALIEDIERMTTEASNSLLKTLEEPPPRTILILTTSLLSHILPTIVSRCQIIKMYPVSVAKIQSWLKDQGVSGKDAAYLSYLSAGRPGVVKEIFENPDILSEQIQILEQLLKLKNQNITKRFDFVSHVLKKRISLAGILDFWILFMRDLLLFKENYQKVRQNSVFKEELQSWSDRYTKEEIRFLLEEISKVQKNINFNINEKLALESLMLHI